MLNAMGSADVMGWNAQKNEYEKSNHHCAHRAPLLFLHDNL
jgi:hypothetical protein